MSVREALKAESEGRIELAAGLYESCLQAEGLPAEYLVNLIVLYWQATDPGIAAAHQFDAFMTRAAERMRSLFAFAAQTFPASPEVAFWKKYIDWCDFGGLFAPEECRALLAEHPEYREPVAFLYMTSRHREHVDEALDLFLECSAKETIRAQYVASLVRPDALRGLTPEDE